MVRTVGVEEELLLVDGVGDATVPVGAAVVHDAEAPGRVMTEFKQDQVEIASEPCTTMTELGGRLLWWRRRVADLAAAHGARVLAAGTSPFEGIPTQSDGGRYDRIAAEFAGLATGQLTCGAHVHVAIESRDEGVAVLDRVRPWLSVLVALSGNSPRWQGRDTGYASYRSVVLSQLPTVGPTPVWGDLRTYEATIEQVLATGAAFDPAMVYYDARLSPSYPTVEIRVADVVPTVEESLLLAALCRGLVTTATAQWAEGRPAPDVPVAVLRGAAWRAARHGLTGELHHPRRGVLAPAWNVVEDLVDEVAVELARVGDLDDVRRILARLRVRGTGADVQRSGRPLPLLEPGTWAGRPL